MPLQTNALLVLLLTVLTSAAPLSVESQKTPSTVTSSNATTSGDTQTTTSNVPLPTIHEQTQESSLKLNNAGIPWIFLHSIVPPAASPGSNFPVIHTDKQKPVNSDIPLVYKRDVEFPYIHSAQLPLINSALPYGLNQKLDILPSSDVSLPTVHDNTRESSLRSDFPVGHGVPSSPDSDLPFVLSEQKPAESTLPSGFKKRDAQPDLPTPDSELSYIHDTKSQHTDSVLPLGF